MTKIYKAKKLKEKKKHLKPKKKITQQGWIAIFLGLIMVLSGMGYMFGSDNTTNNFNGIKFITDGQKWIFTTNQNQILFFKYGGIRHQLTYHPRELEYLNLTDADFLRNTKQLYITTNPIENTEKNQVLDYVKFEMNRELMKNNIIVGNGITQKTQGYDIPIITCKNATIQTPIIEIQYGKNQTTQIKKEGNCLKIEANNKYEMIKVEDALIYKILGVI